MDKFYSISDSWARRHPNRVGKDYNLGEFSPTSNSGKLTKLLLIRILSWAENAKTDKTGQGFVMSDEFKEDMHSAVVFNNMNHSKAGLSSNEKREANNLWKKYATYGRIDPKYRLQTGTPKAQAMVAEIRKLVRSGQKIAAIKLYRHHTDCSLREAKDYCDTFDIRD